ncbi:hypothetical protein D7Y13_44815, partial [Corallococcus praedator]
MASIDEPEVIILESLPIESVGDIDALMVEPEPIIEPIDEPSPPDSDVVVMPAEAIDAPTAPDAELTLDETSMLDA